MRVALVFPRTSKTSKDLHIFMLQSNLLRSPSDLLQCGSRQMPPRPLLQKKSSQRALSLRGQAIGRPNSVARSALPESGHGGGARENGDRAIRANLVLGRVVWG